MKNNKIGFFLMAVAAMGFSACQGNQEGKINYDNKIFITGSNFKNEVRVQVDEGVKELTRSMSVAMGQPENRDINVTFASQPDLLENYRLAYYDPEAELLPEEYYNLGEASTVIKKGLVSSEPVEINFHNLDKLDYTKRYVLPVSISSPDKIDVLERSSTMYFLVKEASLVNVVADINNNWAWPEFNGAEHVKDMTAFTMEALILGHAFNKDETVSTIMGIEDRFLIRLGDVPNVPKNQIQVAYAHAHDNTVDRGSVTDASLQLKADRWYHLAVTFDKGEVKIYLDGKLKAQGNSKTEIGVDTVDFSTPHSDEMDGKPRCFWIGYSYDNKRYFDGMISEARIWNKALTEEEINAENHFYKVAPDSDGLVAYWKFSDGEKNIVKDHSQYGYDLTGDHDFTWVPVELPAK